MDPKKAPKLIREPTQEASSKVSGRIPKSEPFSFNKIGVAGDDHPPTHPVLSDTRDATTKLKSK